MRMLITALRDLQWRLRRFLIATIGTGLVFALTLTLTGLAQGFRVEAERVVDSMPIDSYVIKAGAVGPFMGASRFPQAERRVIAGLAGVDAALSVLYGNTIMLDSRDGAQPQNINVYGVPPGALPPIIQGSPPEADDEIVMSTVLKHHIGDEVEIGAEKARVVGLIDKSTTLAGQGNSFMTVRGAQQLMFSRQPVVTAIGIRGTPQALPDDYKLVNRAGAVDDMVRPLNGARMAMSYMAILLWVVAAIIIGSLIYLSALERTRDFAVFKAVGVGTGSVLSGLVLQAVLVAVLAALLGGAVAVVIGPFFPMIVAVTPLNFLLLMVTAVGIGLVASLAGLQHAVAVDPVLAFGGP